MILTVRRFDEELRADFERIHSEECEAGWCHCVAWWVPTWECFGERSAEENARLFAGVREACEQAGRDPGSMVYSSAVVLCVGRDEAELSRRAAAIGRTVEDLRANALAGTPAEAVDVLGRYAEAGAQRVYLQVLDLADLDHLDLVAAEVAPQLD